MDTVSRNLQTGGASLNSSKMVSNLIKTPLETTPSNNECVVCDNADIGGHSLQSHIGLKNILNKQNRSDEEKLELKDILKKIAFFKDRKELTIQSIQNDDKKVQSPMDDLSNVLMYEEAPKDAQIIT